jgi:hypothetical protein
MSMRGSIRGQRIPKFLADEAARFIATSAVKIIHHKRSTSKKCPDCWDYYAKRPSKACANCIEGFVIEKIPKRGLVSYSQPYGNFGNAAQTFKAGGMNYRLSAYVYMDFLNGRDIAAGDHLVIFQSNEEDQVVVMNIQRQVAVGGATQLFLFETASPMEKTMENV